MTRTDCLKILNKFTKKDLVRIVYNYARFDQGQFPPEERTFGNLLRSVKDLSKGGLRK